MLGSPVCRSSTTFSTWLMCFHPFTLGGYPYSDLFIFVTVSHIFLCFVGMEDRLNELSLLDTDMLIEENISQSHRHWVYQLK